MRLKEGDKITGNISKDGKILFRSQSIKVEKGLYFFGRRTAVQRQRQIAILLCRWLFRTSGH